MSKTYFIFCVILLLSCLSFSKNNEHKSDFVQNLASLQSAAQDISGMHGQNFDLPKYQREIKQLEINFDKEKFESLKKEILLQNPLLGNEILFVTRNQYYVDHHNTATLFQTDEINTASFDPGGALKAFHPQTNRVRTLFESKDGLVRDPEISFDGEKIIASYRKNIDDNYHIYELGADGSPLKQLTFADGISDIDPLYLPDGDIIFSSTREPKYCMCNRHIMANLYRMQADGANITQLGKSTLFEGHPTLLNDGRIIYDRWEYVDRNFGDAQGLWTVNPDGTNHAIYYGNNTNSPGGIIDARAIPGSHLVVCVFSSCHDRPWGAIALLDRSKGVDGKEAVVKIWPAHSFDLIGKGNWDQFMSLDVRYEDPYPLNEKYFLCSKSIWLKKDGWSKTEEKMGIFLIDVFGNELLLHEDEKSCFDPMPIATRFQPRVIPQKRNFADSSGYFYVQNVYEGTHMQGVEKGAVKYLRVVESPPKQTWTHPAWNGQGQQAPGVNWHSFENKIVLGTVEVKPDGSAYFEVPAGKYVYFQLLDENKKMIQSMRSGVIAHPGETNGCIGCHEDRLSVPIGSNPMPLALKGKPEKMMGWNGHTRKFNYLRDVQPVFDNACAGCHDFGTKAGEKLVLAGDKNPYFNASYIDLYVKKQIKCVGGGPAEIQQAYSWGSHASHLVKVIESGHNDINLSTEDKNRIYTWLDLNGIYYPEYESAFPDNPASRSPLTFDQINRLGELTGVEFAKLADHKRTLGPQIAFDRPEKSPCLDNIRENPAKYAEALRIITDGKKMLEQTPRADMEGFIPCPTHLKMLEKYNHRAAVEAKICDAIAAGEKVYDRAE